jgi:hypothetical protein
MTESKNTQDNIFFSITEEHANEDDECTDVDFDLIEIMNEINKINKVDFTYENNDFLIPQIIHYKENFTVKQLLLICEYYGVAKELKSNKCNKDEIIQFLVIYESNPSNSEIFFKRQNMWFYINELKNDKFMKKYVLF